MGGVKLGTSGDFMAVKDCSSVMPQPVWSTAISDSHMLALIREEWVGCVLRYQHHWGDGETVLPVFLIDSDTTVEEFRLAVEEKVVKSGDRHHVFIENFVTDGMWLDILTGS